VSLLSLVLLALCQAGSATVIQVGEVGLTGADVSARVAEHLRTAQGRPPEAEALLGGLVDELLLAQEARRSGLALSPDGKAAVAYARAATLARAYWERELLAKATPSDEQIRSYFHDLKDTVRLRLVVVATRPEAEDVAAQLSKGGDWATQARRSLHRSAAQGGDTGPLPRKDLDPALVDPAFQGPPGKTFGPVELKVGWAVGQVVERTIADEAVLAVEAPVLRSWVKAQLAGYAKNHYLSRARRQEGAQLDMDFLQGLGKRTSFTDAEADHPIATVAGTPIRFREILQELAQWNEGGGHMSGAAMRTRVAQLHLDNVLLAQAATEARLPDQPGVASALRASELRALGRLQAARLAAATPGPGSPAKREEAVQQRLAALRKQYPATIDRTAAIAAIESARRTAPPAQ
jgi:peptidyl-prolyl cis-trans isomerase C